MYCESRRYTVRIFDPWAKLPVVYSNLINFQNMLKLVDVLYMTFAIIYNLVSLLVAKLIQNVV